MKFQKILGPTALHFNIQTLYPVTLLGYKSKHKYNYLQTCSDKQTHIDHSIDNGVDH